LSGELELTDKIVKISREVIGEEKRRRSMLIRSGDTMISERVVSVKRLIDRDSQRRLFFNSL